MNSALEQALAIVNHARAYESARTSDVQTTSIDPNAHAQTQLSDDSYSLIGRRLYASGRLTMRSHAVSDSKLLHVVCDFQYANGEVLQAHLYHSIAYQFINAREQTGRFSIRARLSLELHHNTTWIVDSLVLLD